MSYRVMENKEGIRLIREKFEYSHAGKLCFIGLDLQAHPGLSYKEITAKITPLLEPLLPEYGTEITEYCHLEHYNPSGKNTNRVSIGGYFFKAGTPVPEGLSVFDVDTVNTAHGVYNSDETFDNSTSCAYEFSREQILNDNVPLPGGGHWAAVQYIEGEPVKEKNRFGYIFGVGTITYWDGEKAKVSNNDKFNLRDYAGQRVKLQFSADVKRDEGDGDLLWQLNITDYPVVGEVIEDAKQGVWYKMGGEWEGYVDGAHAVLYANSYGGENSGKATYQVENFKIQIEPIYMKEFYKGLIVQTIPADFKVAEPFRHGLNDNELIAGITAFRQFLHDFHDKIAENYAKMDDFELYTKYLPLLLLAIGANGKLLTGPQATLALTPEDLLKLPKPSFRDDMLLSNVSAEKVTVMLDFLREMGFSIENEYQISHKIDGNIIIGLKLLALATINTNLAHIIPLRDFMRSAYHPLASEVPATSVLQLHDFLHMLTPEEEARALELYGLLTQMNCTVIEDLCPWNDSPIFAFHVPNRESWVCKFVFRRQGFVVTINPEKASNLDDITQNPPANFMGYIWTVSGCGKGNGCDCGQEPFKIWYGGGNEHKACLYFDGFRFPLADREVYEILKRWICAEVGEVDGNE